MAIEIIRNQINQFVNSSTPEVMAIKGDWGVGKTYSWKKFLKEANSRGDVTLERYSYVSLFGINSLESFKYSIFENVIKKKLIGTEASLDTFKQNTLGITESLGRQSNKFLKGIPVIKDLGPAIDALSFLSLNKILICIDDLERKGKGLEIKDILGLISLLKEQKKCKIVLLLNDGEEGLEDYYKYREKVVDIELKFSPSPAECAVIAYDDQTPEQEKLKELVTKLGIKNIRVLKKIERLVENVLPLIQEYEEEVKHQIMHSLVLFSWCYYSSNTGEEIPPLDFVTSTGYSFYGIGDDGEEKEDDDKKKWKATLQEYGYQITDELDLVLAESVRTGFFVESELKGKANIKNAEVVAAKSEGSFKDAWKLYHDSFNNNEDDVISAIYESFKKNVKHISPTNLNGTVTLFRELNEGDKASEIIDIYIEARKEQIGLFDLEESNFFGDIRDEEIVRKFNETYNASVSNLTVKQVLERIAGLSGCSQDDEAVLAKATSEEFYEIFKAEESDRLSSFVRACLKLGQYTNSSEQQKKIADNAIQALKKIAGESELNRLRVKKFGVDP